MSFDYSSFASLASDMLASYGATAVYRKPDRQYDPVSGAMAETVQEVEFQAVMTSPSENALSAGLVQAGDGILLAAGNSFAEAPKAGNAVIWNDQEWRIVSLAAVRPARRPLLYKMTVRKA